jgi:hypothetical protein
MSFIVRHKTTGDFLKGRGEWTNQQGAALQFNTGLRLVDYLERQNLRAQSDALEVMVYPGARPPEAA